MRNILVLGLLVILLNSCGSGSGDQVAYFGDQELKDKVEKQGEELDALREKQEQDYDALNKRLLTLETKVDTLAINIDTNSVNVDILESNVNTILNRVSSLEADTRIDSIDSPCSNSKEMLVYLNDGRILGYFEQGKHAYLSVLSSGTYITTDGTGCRFVIE